MKSLNNPLTVVHRYESPVDCELTDRKAWRQANPGLGRIKSIKYMAAEAARVAASSDRRAVIPGV